MYKEICGECKWHTQAEDCNDKRYVDWVCTNAESPYVTDFTDYNDWCEQFEQRGIE